MFGELLYVGKPFILWACTNSERGSKTLQKPGQLLTLQERAMDWWLYWLKDEGEPSETKREQYAGWDTLRRLRDEDAKRPRPPRLRWTVEPVAAEAGPATQTWASGQCTPQVTAQSRGTAHWNAPLGGKGPGKK